MREAVIEAYLVKRAEQLGGEVRKVKWINRNGAPDRIVMLPKQFDKDSVLRTDPKTIWVELKATGVKPKPAQLREHDRMREMGQRVEVVDSLDGVDRLFL